MNYRCDRDLLLIRFKGLDLHDNTKAKQKTADTQSWHSNKIVKV